MKKRINKPNPRKGLIILSVILALGAVFLHLSNKSLATWYDDNFAYRKKITIGNTGSAVSSARKVLVEVDTAALTTDKMQADCDDTRFTDINGKVLRHFIDTDSGACDTSSTDFFVELTSVTTGDNIIYMYYGNPSAISGRSAEFFAPDAYSSLGNKLKSYWTLDETSGTRYDSGRGNELTDNATVTSATGKISNAADFEQDTSEYLNRADNADLSTGTSDYTVAMWIKPESISATTNQDLIIARKWGSDAADQEWNLRVKSGASPSIKMEVLSGVTSGGTIAAGNWYFVVATVDYDAALPSISVTGYIDNVQKLGGGFSGTAGRDGAADFQIGGNNPDLLETKYFDGLIDNAMFWKRTLTADERTALYNAGNGLSFGVVTFSPTSGPTLASEETTPGPAAYWKFDDGQGSTAQDTTVNNNDGTLGTGSSAPTWTEESRCVSGKCLQFDGSNDYVSVANSSSLSPTIDLTLSAWIKLSATPTGDGFSVLYKDSDTNSRSWGIAITTTKKVSSIFFKTNTSYALITGNSILALNQWYHVDSVYHYITDGTSTVDVYINGVKDAPQVTNGVGPIQAGSSTIQIGAREYSSSRIFFKGFIDEPKIYPYARTAAQVKADFAKGSGAKGGGVLGAADTSVLSNGLVGYWKADESSGNAADSSGNASTLTNNNTTTYTAGKFGNASTFASASSQSLSVTDNTALSVSTSTDFTIAGWFNMSTVQNTFLAGKFDVCTATNREYALQYLSGFNFNVRSSDNSSDQGVTANAFGAASANTWYFVAAWYDSVKQTLNIQVNGGAVDSTSITGGARDGSTAFSVGGAPGACSNRYMDGKTDEVRIYKRVLSGAERSQLYNFAPGPVGHWKMDEKTGTSANDSSTYGNTGTLGAGTSAPTWTNGKYGSGLNFDGSNDYVSVGSNSSLNPSQLTYSAWVKSSTDANASVFSISNTADATKYIMFAVGPFTALLTDELFGVVNNDTGVRAGYTSSNRNELFDGNWHYISVTANGSAYKLYLDGQSKTVTIGQGSDNGSPSITGFNSANIGARNTGSLNSFWNGKLDDVKIYNYARNSKQIVEDMNAGHPAGGSPVGSAIGYWKFDEGQGITANNSGFGTSLNGTLTTMASPATTTSGWTNSGKFGKALVFDGISDYVTVADSGKVLSFSTAGTISYWFKRPTLGTHINVGKYIQTGSLKNSLLQVFTDNKIYFTVSDTGSGDTAYFTSTNTFTSTDWNHLVGVYNGSTLVVYLNGILLAGTTTGTVPASLYNSSGPFEIGRYNGGNYSTGFIDEVKVYNGALTAAEVKIDYNRGASIVLGALSDNSSYEKASANQEYCLPGDTTSCAAPVGEWKLDEGTGTSANDTSGNANTGTLGAGSSAPTWSTGKIGKALSFDGSEDSVSVAHSSSVAPTSLTAQMWIKPSTTLTTGSYGPMIRKDSNDMSSSGAGFNIIYYNGALTAYLNTDSDAVWDCFPTYTTTFTANTWYHIAISKGSTGVYYYVNGVLVTSSTSADCQAAINYRSTTNSLFMGYAFGASIGSRYFPGIIDNVRLYDYARTAAQVAWDYNRGAPVARYKFDECQGPTAYDASGNSLNGTITIGSLGSQSSLGTCVDGSSTSAWYNGATGKFNSSLNFDGTDDYVSVADNSLLRIGNQGSISVWIKSSSILDGAGIVSKRNGDATGNFDYTLRRATNGNVYFQLGTVSSLQTFTTDTNDIFTDGIWTYITATWDGTTMKVYSNGVFRDSTSQTLTHVGISGINLFIGASYSSNGWFTGQIDDVRIYNYALSAAQVKTVMNDGSAVRFGPNTGAP